MRKKILIIDVLILIIVFLLVSGSNAQFNQKIRVNEKHNIIQNAVDVQIPAFEIWNKTYGGLAPDGLSSIKKTSIDNGFIMCGYSYSYSNGKEDMWIVKTDDEGNELWNTSFGDISHDKALDIIETNDQEYLAIGQMYSSETFSYDCYLVKLDRNGNKKWEKTFGGNGSDSGTIIQTSSDDGFVFILNSEINDETLCSLIKINKSGIIEWEIAVNDQLGSDVINGLSICKTIDEDFVLTGQLHKTKNGLDAFIIKITDEGEIQWQKTFGGTYTDFFRSIYPSSEGFILCGTTRSFGQGSYDVWLLSTDESGNELWNKTFGAESFEEGYSIQPVQNEGYIIVGYTSSFSVDQTDLWLIQTDTQGNMMWNETFGGVSSDKGSSLADLGNNEYVIAGNLNGDGWLLKFHFFTDNSLKTSVFYGSIHQVYAYTDNLSIIQAKQLTMIQFSSFTLQTLTDQQLIIIYENYSGLMTPRFIMGIFQATII